MNTLTILSFALLLASTLALVVPDNAAVVKITSTTVAAAKTKPTTTAPLIIPKHTTLSPLDSCDDHTKSFSGTFKNRGYPLGTGGHYTCAYRFLKMQDYETVKIHFIKFQLSQLTELVINQRSYRGNDLSDQTLELITPVEIIFHSRSSSDKSVYFAAYNYLSKDKGCPQQFTLNHGTMQSPYYPLKYLNGLYCDYSFEKKDYCGIKLKFTEFNLQFSKSCEKDYLSINNIRYCGNELEGKHVLITPSTQLSFRSDKAITARGFSAKYSYTTDCSKTCETAIDDTSGVILSRGFPTNYEDNENCTYIFKEISGYKSVELDFTSFSVVPSRQCVNDHLDIDGFPYCGNTLNNKRVIKPLPLTLQFKTDSTETDSGFVASYRYFNEKSCGGDYPAMIGFINPPKLDSGFYGSRLRCLYKIRQVNDAKCVKLSFVGLKNLCKYGDYIEVGGQVFCEPPSTNSFSLYFKFQETPNDGNYLPIHFVSDSSLSVKEAFTLEFQQEKNITFCPKKRCQPLMRATDGHLRNPSYPSDYPNNYECEYVIEAAPNMIKIYALLMDELADGDLLEITSGTPGGVLQYNTAKEIDFPKLGGKLQPIVIKFTSNEEKSTTFGINIIQN